MNDWKWYYFIGLLLGLVTVFGIVAWLLWKDDIKAKWAEGATKIDAPDEG